MSRDCLPSLPSASKPWLAAGATLFYLLGSHLLLPEHAPGNMAARIMSATLLCLHASSSLCIAIRDVFPIAASVNQ